MLHYLRTSLAFLEEQLPLRHEELPVEGEADGQLVPDIDPPCMSNFGLLEDSKLYAL